jgi:hypothetical protein
MEMAKQARGGTYTEGLASFLKVLQAYREEGSLQGIDVASRTL